MSNDNRRVEPASLIERAAEVYDFGAALRGRGGITPPLEERSQPAAATAVTAIVQPVPETRTAPACAGAAHVGPVAAVDRSLLRDNGFIIPDSTIDTLAEEFRLVKRQLLLRTGAQPSERTPKDRMVLVCSAQPNEGKTFCAVNLALSLAEAFAGRRWVALLQAERQNLPPMPRRMLRLEAERAADEVLAWRERIAASQAVRNYPTKQE